MKVNNTEKTLKASFTKGLHAEKWSKSSLDVLINEKYDLLKGRNEGCDRHTGKITQSPFSPFGLMNM